MITNCFHQCFNFLLSFRYVLEHGSPYMRNAKNTSGKNPKARHLRSAAEEVEDDLRRAGLLGAPDSCKVKDSVPDQQLTFQQLLIRYKGNCSSALSCHLFLKAF